MSFSESMFLFELDIQEVEKYAEFSSFFIKCRFADLFITHIEDTQNLITSRFPKKTKAQKKSVAKHKRKKTTKQVIEPSKKSVLFSSSIANLMLNMKRNPIEVTLWRHDVRQKIGLAWMPWNFCFLQYLNDLSFVEKTHPISITADYYALDERTSVCMARLKMTGSLCIVQNTVPRLRRSSSEKNLTLFYARFIINQKNKAEDKEIEKQGDNNVEVDPTEKTNKNLIIDEKAKISNIGDKNENGSIPIRLLNLVRSDTEISKQPKPEKETEIIISKSYTAIGQSDKVFVVSYFTVQDDKKEKTPSNSPPASGKSSVHSSKAASTHSATARDISKSILKYSISCKKANERGPDDEVPEKFSFQTCANNCPVHKLAKQTDITVNLPKAAEDIIKVTQCKPVECDNRPHRPPPQQPDDERLIDYTDIVGVCCQKTERVEGTVVTQMAMKGVPCECTCECSFQYVKKTTYCQVCGGFEVAGDDFERKVQPCPIFHKLIDVKRLRAMSISGSSKSVSKQVSKVSNTAVSSGSKSSATKSNTALKAADKKSVKGGNSVLDTQAEKDSKKSKNKRKIDPRFIFHYGFTGIPARIGHGSCANPCSGHMDPVPKNMGWLWDADNVPGLKFRPAWRPGAIHKYVLMMLRNARHPGLALEKKKRKTFKKKKNPKRPLLIVSKQNGEYTVTMETMKTYTKGRNVSQQPFEDKPVLTYTIGRTEEENRRRQWKKDRDLLQLQQEQRQFITENFKNMCDQVCVKTYQQALGILPNTEDPPCPCFTLPPEEERPDLPMCPCDDKENFSGSEETDDDEWVIEFTPPNALYYPDVYVKKTSKMENSSQYSYLDYRVKLLDHTGKEYPRYFKGPDGTTICGDLGGFYDKDHKWQAINIDGIIGPDGKWCPKLFIGPNGDTVEVENGKFYITNLGWYVIGVDGYVDANGKWRNYPRARSPQSRKGKPKEARPQPPKGVTKTTPAAVMDAHDLKLSCFGDTSPGYLSELGIVGHGMNKKLLLAALQKLIAHGVPVNLPQPSSVPRLGTKKARKSATIRLIEDRSKCHHSTPSKKGIIIDERGRKKYFRINFLGKNKKKRKEETDHYTRSKTAFHTLPELVTNMQL